MRGRGKEGRERTWFRDAKAVDAIHSIDSRCQTRVATAARKLGGIQADHAGPVLLSSE